MTYYITAIGKLTEKVLPFLCRTNWENMKEGSLVITDTDMVDYYEEARWLGEACGINIENQDKQLIESIDIELLEKLVGEGKFNKFIVMQIKGLLENNFKLFLRQI